MALASTIQQARINFPNDHDYTLQTLVEELSLLERHARDQSWKLCGCIAGKHLPLISGLSSEAVGFSDSDEERKFMQETMTKARLLKRDIDKGIIRSQEHFDTIRAWARTSRKRIERKKWVGDYSTSIDYQEKDVPDSVLKLVEDLNELAPEIRNNLTIPELEEEMTKKMVHHLCDKYNIPYPEIKFIDGCNPLFPNAAHIQRYQITPKGIIQKPEEDRLVFCRGGATAYAISHEFSHLKDHHDGEIVANEGKANRFATKEVTNHLYTLPVDNNLNIQDTQNNLTGKNMSLKMTKAQSDKGLTVIGGLTAAKIVSEYDPQITQMLGPLGTMIGKIGVGAIAAWYGLTKVKGTMGDLLLFAGAELALNEVFKKIQLGGPPAPPIPGNGPGARLAARGPVALPLTPGRAVTIPGASSTIRAAAPFMRTFTTPTRLTAGYPQVAQADGKFIQIRV